MELGGYLVFSVGSDCCLFWLAYSGLRILAQALRSIASELEQKLKMEREEDPFGNMHRQITAV